MGKRPGRRPHLHTRKRKCDDDEEMSAPLSTQIAADRLAHVRMLAGSLDVHDTEAVPSVLVDDADQEPCTDFSAPTKRAASELYQDDMMPPEDMIQHHASLLNES